MRRLALIGLAAALAAGGALAQTAHAPAGPAPAAPANDPNAPYDISSDSQELDQPNRLITLRGNVEIIQNQDRLRAPVVRIYYKERQGGPKPPPGANPGYGNSVDHIDADGPVYYVTPTESAKGDHGHYDGNTQIMTLTGNVILTQGRDVSTGDKLVSNRRTGQSVLTSNNPATPGRRVRAVLYPQNNDQPGAKPAGATPPPKTTPKAPRP